MSHQLFHFHENALQKLLKHLCNLIVLFLICGFPYANAAKVVVFNGTSADELNALINKAPEHTLIRLAPGVFEFRKPIIVSRSNIKIAGSGRGLTYIRFNLSTENAGDFFKISGGNKKQVGLLLSNAFKRSYKLELEDAHRLNQGDTIYISRPNTRAFLSRKTWENVSTETAMVRPFRETIVSVDGVDGQTVRLSTELPFTFPGSISSVYKIDTVKNVRISDLTITSSFGIPRPNSFKNTLGNYKSAAAIRLYRTSRVEITRLDILDVPSKGIAIDSSLNAQIDDIYIDGSHNKGPSGEGYGIELRETFDSSLLNLTILNTRHSVLFSSWHAEVGNEVHIKYTNRDVNFHGGLDHSNRISIDQMTLQYEMSERNGRPKHAWSALAPGGRKHPANNFVADNRIVMKLVQSSWRKDVLIASDIGSNLNSGAGDDIIIGGAKRDFVTGGPGADQFILGVGGDVVIDFEVGSSGDALLLPLTFDEVTVSAYDTSEGLVINYENTSRILLLGVSISQLTSDNIIYCSNPCAASVISKI